MRVHHFAAAVSQLTKPEHLLHRLRPCTAGRLSALFLCDWEMSLDLCPLQTILMRSIQRAKGAG